MTATFGRRLGAWLIDSLLYGLLSLVFVIPGIVLVASAFADCTTRDTGDDIVEIVCPPGSPDVAAIVGGIALGVAGVLLVAFVYVRAMGSTGQPWGARIVGVRVVGQRTGTPIGFGAALGRSLFANVFSSSVFWLGYLWMLWDDDSQTWHDKVVSSVVVEA